MKIKTIKTRVLLPPQDDLIKELYKVIPKIKEKSILVISSKVVSIWQGRCLPKDKVPNRDELIKKESDLYLSREQVPGAWCMHTIKNNIFIPSAGIDESNANDHFILWPKKPYKTAEEIWKLFRKKYKVRNLGIIIVDSHTIALRRGVLGLSLGYFGFAPLKDYRGKGDIFGRELKMTQTNIADGLSAAAVMLMGEGKECTPVAMITDVDWIDFRSTPVKYTKKYSSFEIKSDEDMYSPFFKSVKWQKGDSGKHT